jgi:hypothetical protein
MPSQSNLGVKRIFKDDLGKINDEGYSETKYVVKRMPFKKKMDVGMV